MSEETFNPFTDDPYAPAAGEPAREPGAERDEEEAPLPPNARVLHVTEIDRFLECAHRSEKIRARHWHDVQDAPRSRGSGVHAAREFAFKVSLKSGGQLPPCSDLEEVARDTVRELMLGKGGEALELLPAEQAKSLEAETDATVDETIAFVRGDYGLLLPVMAPHVIAAEVKMRSAIEGPGLEPGVWWISGTPDSLGRDPTTGKLVLPDLKTSSKATTQAALNTSSQLTGYALLARERYGEIPVLAHHSLRLLKRAPKPKPGQSFRTVMSPSGAEYMAVAERKMTERSDRDLASFALRVRAVIEAILAGFALPATAGNFLSPCHNCAFRGHAIESQRCEYAPAYVGGEGGSEDE